MMRGKLLLTISVVVILSFLAALLPVAAVSAAAGSINISQYSGAVGTSIQVTGAGYTPSSSYYLIFGTSTTLAGTVNTVGTFYVTFTIPAYPAGTYPITVTTSAGDTTSSPPSFAILPSISPSTNSGQVGSQLSLSGTGFAANITIYVYLDNTPIVGTQAASNGTFTGLAIQIPETSAGSSHNIRAIDSLGNSAYSAFTISPKLTANPTSLASGSNQVSIAGSGFSASSPISVTFDNAAVSASINTGSNGSFVNTTISLPAVSAGSHTLKATDGSGLSASVVITTSNSITISPQSGQIGSQVTIIGTGFGAGKSITINYNNSVVATNPPAVADASGNFKTFIIVPRFASATYTITATDGTSSASGKFTSSAVAGTGTPASGIAGTDIPVSGYGFISGATINIKFDNTLIGTARADASGSFSTTIKLPAVPAGTHTIVATDGTNNISITISVIASSTSNINSGVVGTDIAVSGNGFNANSTITIKFDSVTLGTAAADANGTFSTTIKLPASQAGGHIITVTDGTNSSSFNVSVTPSAQITGTSGYAGTTITLSGSAFVPNATLTVKYDSTTIATTQIDSNGSFTVNFKAPVSQIGAHNISATDGVNNPTFTFNLTAAALPPPDLAYPAKGAKADSPAKFQWNPVTSPNGEVTYNFQISQDSGFSVILIDKKALTSTGYQLSDQEKLKSAGANNPYYWRVQAVDSAGDVSPWSNPSTFTVGYIMPAWLLYFIYAVIAIVVFGIGFVVGRRSARI